MITKTPSMTVDEAWNLFEAHIKNEKKIPYENLTTTFSELLRSSPRVQDSFEVGPYIVETSDCFHFLAFRVVGLSDWFNYAVINTYNASLTWGPEMVYFEGSDGEEYVINIDEKALYKRVN